MASMLLTRHLLVPMLRSAPHARLLQFGATVSGISVLEFIGSSLDTLVIGRFGTASQLGTYSRAFTLASLPTYR
jgi:lipopolysaccharide exporter